MFPLRVLRKSWNDKLILERTIFTEAFRSKAENLTIALTKKCEQHIPFFFYKRNINISRKCFNQDPYSVLGLSRNATTSEIKKQFRLLAKKYHPDINPSPDAKQKMASITAAYELLSDPKKKEFYDKTGMTDEGNYENHASSNFEGGFSGFGDASFMFTDFAEMFTNMAGGKNTSTRGEDIQTEITLQFMEAIKGCEKNIRLNVKVSCNNCNGSGKKPGTNMTICKVCNGSGIQRMERGPIIIGVPCRNCSGNGQIINNPCKHCSGSGVKFQTKNITLDIPPGIKKGMQMRIPNQGHSGYRGGKNGHLFVTINIEPHKIFKWVDDNIYVDVPLTIKQCLLGGIVNVPTLNGDIDLLIKPKTYPNSEKVLKGKGPCKVDSHTNGDLVIKFSLKIPEKLTPRQVELIEEFNRIELNLGNPQSSPRRSGRSAGSSAGSSGENVNMTNAYSSEGNTTGMDRGIPKPPPASQKKSSINNLEGHNASNIPIPPLPPKSSPNPSRDNAKGRNSGMNGDNKSHGNVSEDSSYHRDQIHSADNVSEKKSEKTAYNFNNDMSTPNSNHASYNEPHEWVNNKPGYATDQENEKRRDPSTSTFSYAKKWITDKLKPKS
ncbi:heat shock protein 40, putative [Plasmodium ovale]|uniref:DnaJ protein, putative n=2 Tax=Plasmodium ovale TaxID=36330 RepID=A0A1A8VKU5_PLAOA|nr:DnaJ protein, putative [Plasmodium ovale curtisi]SBS80915.1 DnaJ protein, putative [Plasmodium ovale curtisi]SCA48389.1 heat shock protein 40, putative [Plasmodium ovale]